MYVSFEVHHTIRVQCDVCILMKVEFMISTPILYLSCFLLRSLQQTLNFYHSLFPKVEGTPHALQLIVVTLYCHLVEHGVIRLSKLHLDVIHSISRSPVVKAGVRCEQGQIEPIRRPDARESCKN